MNDLKQEVIRVRFWFRWMGKQFGDDACWLDPEKVFTEVFLSYQRRAVLPPKEECLKNCEWFCREFADPPEPQHTSVLEPSNDDLKDMDEARLRDQLYELICATIELDRLPVRERGREAYAKFFSVLPEGAEPYLIRQLLPFPIMQQSCHKFFDDPNRAQKLHEW